MLTRLIQRTTGVPEDRIEYEYEYEPNRASRAIKATISPSPQKATEHRGPSGPPRHDHAIFLPFPPHRTRARTDMALGDRRREVVGGR